MCQQRITHAGIALADACAKDRPIEAFALGKKIVQIDRHMGAVEVAKADMDDAGGQFAAVIAGHLHGL
ncbi:MAG: hypothetical protein ACD_54C00284G0001 [uncultured bacterium]|nr:MAG: hypothetical protein ACD_54C00284G0001 [uncultured bacterium]